MKCSKCHFDNPPDTVYCGKYATPLPSAEDISIAHTETLETPIKDLTTGVTIAGKYKLL